MEGLDHFWLAVIVYAAGLLLGRKVAQSLVDKKISQLKVEIANLIKGNATT